MLLMDSALRAKAQSIRHQARHVRLDGNSYFSQRYVEHLLFANSIR